MPPHCKQNPPFLQFAELFVSGFPSFHPHCFDAAQWRPNRSVKRVEANSRREPLKKLAKFRQETLNIFFLYGVSVSRFVADGGKRVYLFENHLVVNPLLVQLRIKIGDGRARP
ncbi:MAG: hypothetical protein ACLQVY_22605 [Limisphaerales bacterium]